MARQPCQHRSALLGDNAYIADDAAADMLCNMASPTMHESSAHLRGEARIFHAEYRAVEPRWPGLTVLELPAMSVYRWHRGSFASLDLPTSASRWLFASPLYLLTSAGIESVARRPACWLLHCVNLSAKRCRRLKLYRRSSVYSRTLINSY